MESLQVKVPPGFLPDLISRLTRVPETATLLLGGGVNFAELTSEAAERFQENLLHTMLKIEDVFFDLAAATEDRNVLVICDRGTMDASAFITREQWESILQRAGLDEVEIRDNRYNQVVHMVSAAKGAEEFYTIEDNIARTEGLEEARVRDTRAAEAWVGHPYVDVIDNSSGERQKDGFTCLLYCLDFETKINNLISRVAWSIGIDIGDRLRSGAKKVKFVVNGPLPGERAFKCTLESVSAH